MSSSRRFVILEDHALMREALVARLTASFGAIDVVYQGGSIAEAVALTTPESADCVILDLDLDDGRTAEANITEVIECGVPVLIVSALASHTTIKFAFAAGVCGFIAKSDDPEEFTLAVESAIRGEKYTSPEAAAALLSDSGTSVGLSEQEKRAMMLYASGLKMRAVARAMGITEGTAREYIRRMRAKYDRAGRRLPTKTDIYRAALEEGILT